MASHRQRELKAVSVADLDLEDVVPWTSDLEDSELLPTLGTTRGAAIPASPRLSYMGGEITAEEADLERIEEFRRCRFEEIEEVKRIGLEDAQRQYREAKERAAEVRRLHRIKRGIYHRHRGASRERRPGPCRSTGSRRSRSRSTSRSRARSPGSSSGDSDPDSDSAGLSPLLVGEAGR